MKPSLTASGLLIFEALACVWVLNQHVPGLLVAPLPMPLWQRVALFVALIIAVLPIAIGLAARRTAERLVRLYLVLAAAVGIVLWAVLLAVHPLEAPPFAIPRIWVSLALLVPGFVIPALLLRERDERDPQAVSRGRRALYVWWLLVGTFSLGEAIGGEFVRLKEWRLMSVESERYAIFVDDPRRFRIAPHAHWMHHYSSDPGGYFGPRLTIEYRANSRGIRERELPIPKPPDVFRIVALGDSFTLGEGVRVEDTWPRQLEGVLRRYYPGRVLEVINAGVNAYDIRQELEHYRRNMREYEPDMVILAMVWNDARPGDAARFGAGVLGSTAALAQYLPVGDRVLRALAAALGQTGVPSQARDWQDAFDALVELKAETAASGIPLIVAIYPSVRHLGNQQLWALYELQENFCREHDLRVFNAAPLFKSQPARRWHVHPADNHPNAEAHRLFAEHLGRFIAPNVDGTFSRTPSAERP